MPINRSVYNRLTVFNLGFRSTILCNILSLLQDTVLQRRILGLIHKNDPVSVKYFQDCINVFDLWAPGYTCKYGVFIQ